MTTEDVNEEIEKAMDTPIPPTTTRPLPPGHGSNVSEGDLHQRAGRSYYAPPLENEYVPSAPPEPALDHLLPHERERVEDEQNARAIGAQVLRRIFTNTYQRAGLPTPPELRTRRPRGLLARLAGMIRLSR